MSEELTLYIVDPSETGSGRPDDFDATIVSNKFRFKRYSENTFKHGIFAEIGLQIDGEEEIYYEQQMIAGPTNYEGTALNLVISPDGKHLAGPPDVTKEDWLALGRGDDGATMVTGTEDSYTGNFLVSLRQGWTPKYHAHAQLLDSIKMLYPDPNDPKGTLFPLSPGADSIVGYRFHFKRLPQDDRMKSKKKKDDGKPQQEYTVLCATDALGKVEVKSGGKKTTAKPASASAPATAAASTDDGDSFESRLETAILELLSEDSQPLTELRSQVLNSFKSGADKGAAIKLINNAKWMSNADRPWTNNNGALSI